MSSLPEALTRATLPAPVRTVVERLQGAGHRAYLVGGCVRDLLRGQAPKDFDVATSARPEQVQAVFERTLPTGIQHGTVTVVLGKWHVEVTTFRSEGAYVDGRRPSEVRFEDEVQEDLSRRDFTVNAMAFDPTRPELVDPFGGQADLQAKVIRCVGLARDRFGEDGLRPLRAVRFSAVLDFALDSDTEAAIPATLEVFRKVAQERVREEFVKLLLSRRAAWGLELLARTGLLACMLPEVGPYASEASRTVGRLPPVLELRLAALFVEQVEPARTGEGALQRLRFSAAVVKAVTALLSHRVQAASDLAAPVQVRRLASQLGVEATAQAVTLWRARGPHPPAEGDAVSRRVEDVLGAHPPLTTRDLALGGREIMAVLGTGPSPHVGAATRFLLELVLEEPSLNHAEALTPRLADWARKNLP